MGGVLVFAASTGALYCQEEVVFRQGEGRPGRECWWWVVLEWAPKPEPGKQATEPASAASNAARLGPNTAPETNGGQFDNREHNNSVIYSISDQDSDWQGQQRREVGDEWEGGWPSAVGKNGM